MTGSVNYPLISVVIPSFNQGQYIEETLLSVIGQQYPNLEILVIDGGSTDNTVEILEKYSSQISYWHSKKDKGQADAINQGINLSSGDIVCWLNSDDMYLPGTLLDIGKRFLGRTDKSHLIYGSAVTINQSKEKLFSDAQTAAPFEEFKLTYADFIVQPSAFWTRKLWQYTGELDIKYNYVLDWEWFIRASKIAEFEYIHKFYSIYRYHPLHKTSNGGLKRREEILDVVSRYSSKYWERLYQEIHISYNIIKKKYDFLNTLKIPKKSFILSFLLPRIMSSVKSQQDFYTVLCMYGL
ncbi:glycosyltransferase family 2 protein [Mastigocladopsis repens]|uniref:glycosyltransferase family 2 protein n=1 Tax=Mastigocladopsis repens TaxID=221287 RepID=UPI00031A3F04|nr:glycosyltransferase family 2 protein [Mastigocladopsis repens]